jgi:hypothetical protein
MTCAINNQSSYDISEFEPLVHDLYQFADNRFGFRRPPTINFVSDSSNHALLGKTAYYDPNNMHIVIYTDNRHPKDMLRSIAHELIHHKQNEEGQFDNDTITGEGYAQKNPHLRKMEKEAYLEGNLCLRDWEDGYKTKNKDIFYERRIRKMSTNKWKNKELNGLLNERWGFSMDLGELNERKIEEEVPDHDPEKHGKIKVPDGPGPYSITDQGKMVQTEAEEDEAKDEKSDHEAEILGALEAEGGAADMDKIVDITGLAKDDVRKAEKESDDIQKHRDGDYIDMTGLEEEKDEDEEDKNEDHCYKEDQLQEAKMRKAAREAIRRIVANKRK